MHTGTLMLSHTQHAPLTPTPLPGPLDAVVMSKSVSSMQHNSSKNGYNLSKTRCNFLNNLDLGEVVSPDPPSASQFVATKLIGTLGPSCHDVDTLSASEWSTTD